MKKWTEDDDKFKGFMASGHQWELFVASKLMAAGLCVQVTLPGMNEDMSQSKKFANQKDIIVGRNNPVTLEVKSRKFAFTGIRDVPYGGRPFVTTVNSWDIAKEKPFAFVIVSRKTGGIITVPSYTFKDWDKEYVYDSDRGIYDWTYVAQKENMRAWGCLVDLLVDKFNHEIEVIDGKRNKNWAA